MSKKKNKKIAKPKKTSIEIELSSIVSNSMELANSVIELNENINSIITKVKDVQNNANLISNQLDIANDIITKIK